MDSKIITTIKECVKKGFLQKMNLNDNAENKRYAQEIKLVREILKNIEFTEESYNFLPALEANLPRDLFLSSYERRYSIESLRMQLERYVVYERSRFRPILRRNGSVSLFFDTKSIDVLYDMIVREGNTVEIIRFKKSAPTLSPKARKEENKPENDIGLYLLYKAGKQLYPNSRVVASYYHLKSKNDKNDFFVEEFELKPTYNIVSHSFSVDQGEHIQEEIDSLLARDLNLFAEETSDRGNCRECYLKNVCERSKEKNNIVLVPLQEELKKASGNVQLTDGQRKAVDFEEGIARVNAGAGTGKTTTIALRVVELLKKGVDPSEILLITFTKKAVEEMYEKIGYWTKQAGLRVNVKRLNIFTFNSFGMIILSENHEKAGYTQKPTIASKITQFDLIFDLLDETPIEELNMRNPLLNFPNAKGAVIELASWFNNIKVRDLKEAKDFAELMEIELELAEKVFNLYNKYNQKLKEKNMIEYHDQIKLTIELLQQYPEIRRKYSYTHIMVDEYQDTDPTQVQLIKVLMLDGNVRSFMVVGDDSQAIYRFRLADQNNILNFHEGFENVEDIFMVENFRSTRNILHSANLLNQRNTKRIEKELVSGTNTEGQMPLLVRVKDKETEYQKISDKISELKEVKGYDFSKIAVISRTGEELFMLKHVLEKDGIPCQLHLPVKLTDYRPIQDIIALTKVFSDRADTLSSAHFVLSNISNDQLQIVSLMDDVHLNSFVRGEIDKINIPELIEEKLPSFFEFAKTFYAEDEVALEFIAGLEELHFGSILQLVSYLNKMEMYQDNTVLEKEESKYNAVTLITAHSSKGKEYDVVFVLLDKFEGNVDQDDLEQIEEERRLLFVAMTRAKKVLYLYYFEKDKICRYVDELENVDKLIIQ